MQQISQYFLKKAGLAGYGLEAVLDVMPLDLYAQCMAAQAARRVRGRNQSRWDGIGCGHLRGHLFWTIAYRYYLSHRHKLHAQ